MAIKPELEQLAVNTIRIIAAEGVEKAKSGHPGMPMGMADCAFVLFNRHMFYNSEDPGWMNRDRFILSAGHGSMLLYTMLHLTGYDVTVDDLMNFRQWNSRTPGHPEYNCLPGIETTTGPLGQGFANGVGMALAEKILSEHFNTPLFSPLTHRIYGIVSDGDLMEGISAEAASLAGHLKLGNIIYIYDDNQITIEGKTDLTFSEDIESRFCAYGWHTSVIDGHNRVQISDAIEQCINVIDKPSLIIAKSHIAYGSPNKHDNASSHGSPLGESEIKLVKEYLKWPYKEAFVIPEEVKNLFDQRKKELKIMYNEWCRNFEIWKKSNGDKYLLWNKMLEKKIPDKIENELFTLLPDKPTATRVTGGVLMQKIAEMFPGLCGGSADLSPSTKTMLTNQKSIKPGDFKGRNIHFGIREHAMGGILNGMSLYQGLIPYGSTFLIFSDYMRPSIRLAALMKIQVIYVFTHDSIFVGEDGPTHQPIEHLAALRAIPNLTVFRPADGVETALSWICALKKQDGPTALCLTRQNVPNIIKKDALSLRKFEKGGYVLQQTDKKLTDIILVASGSELSIAANAGQLLSEKGWKTRVVSMPSLDTYLKQPESYKNNVILPDIPVAIIEAGIDQGWYKITRSPILFIGMNRFGASAPENILAEQFGFTGSSIAKKVIKWISKGQT